MTERNDAIQFSRLLCEIKATQELDMRALALSMDMGTQPIEELFDRAHEVWERAFGASKDNTPPTACLSGKPADEMRLLLADMQHMAISDEQKARVERMLTLVDEAAPPFTVVAVGNAFDGMTLRGPFPYHAEAIQWAEANGEEDWRVINLLDPEAP